MGVQYVAPLRANRQSLVFDADDTLWENNIYFERAVAEFVSVLDHSSLSAAEVQAVLDEIQHHTLATHGYGAASFAHSLAESYRQLAERHISDEDLARVRALGERILSQELELLPGVAETLPLLATRHHLTLLTKGNLDEQRLKVERSDLTHLFAHVEIVPEKDANTYRRLAATHSLAPAATWMIGNSPRSDINPALAAGLNAVFIPHSATWRREIEQILQPEDPARLLIVERFDDLQRYFSCDPVTSDRFLDNLDPLL